MSDLGFTHIALVVRSLTASIAFYRKYAAMEVVHRRPGEEPGAEVAWISDHMRPFVIVLIQSPGLESHPLGPISHLGVACATRAEVDRFAEEARAEGLLRLGPIDGGPPIGYYTFIADPDGNMLELSHGQEVAFTVQQHE